MSAENKCPHCGADVLDEHIESKYFGCGSTEWYWPGHTRYLFERGNDCYERQIAALRGEIEKAYDEGFSAGAMRVHRGVAFLDSRAKRIAEGPPLLEPPKE